MLLIWRFKLWEQKNQTKRPVDSSRHVKSINLPKTIMEEYGMKTKVKIRILFQGLLI